MSRLIRFVLAALCGLLLAVTFGCGLKEEKVAEKPNPIVIAFFDRSASTEVKKKKGELTDWQYHAGVLQIICDTLGYERNWSLNAFTFARGLGTILQDVKPGSFAEVNAGINKYVTTAPAEKRPGTFGEPALEQAIELAKINPDHPIFIYFGTDLLLNDVDKARGKIRMIRDELPNVQCFFAGPVNGDPQLRQQYTARFFPGPVNADRFKSQARHDLIPALQEAVKVFKEKNFAPVE